MAVGRLQEAAKYSDGVWEQFPGIFRVVGKPNHAKQSY